MPENILDELKKRMGKKGEDKKPETVETPGKPIGEVFSEKTGDESPEGQPEKAEKTEEILAKLRFVSPAGGEKSFGEKKPDASPETKKPVSIGTAAGEKSRSGEAGVFGEKIRGEEAGVSWQEQAGKEEETAKKESSGAEEQPAEQEKAGEQESAAGVQARKEGAKQGPAEKPKEGLMESKGHYYRGASIPVIDKPPKIVVGEKGDSEPKKKLLEADREPEFFEGKSETEAQVAHELFDDKVEKQETRQGESKTVNLIVAGMILISIIVLAVIWYAVFQ